VLLALRNWRLKPLLALGNWKLKPLLRLSLRG
jgi:hypothetical protein